jgi:hypothetical protein
MPYTHTREEIVAMVDARVADELAALDERRTAEGKAPITSAARALVAEVVTASVRAQFFRMEYTLRTAAEARGYATFAQTDEAWQWSRAALDAYNDLANKGKPTRTTEELVAAIDAKIAAESASASRGPAAAFANGSERSTSYYHSGPVGRGWFGS